MIADVDPPEGWERHGYEGRLGEFHVLAPVVAYENHDTGTRVLAKPWIPTVDAEESRLTVEAVTDRTDDVGCRGERLQTIWYDAAKRDRLPLVFPDAPLDDDRFADITWRVAVQPVSVSPDAREDRSTLAVGLRGYRPDKEGLPVVWMECDGRSEAAETTQFLLDRAPRFDEDDPIWVP